MIARVYDALTFALYDPGPDKKQDDKKCTCTE